MPFASGGNSVSSSSQIVDGIITGADLAADTLTTREIGPNAVADSEIATHQTTKITLPVANLVGNVGTTQGGTGAASASAGFDALAPTTTRGDIIYRGASSNLRLGAGAAGQVLKANGAGADPSWGSSSPLVGNSYSQVSVSSTTAETNLLSVTVNGGTLGTTGGIFGRLFINSMGNDGNGGTVFKLKYGGTILGTITTGASVTNQIGYIDFAIFASGATGTQVGIFTQNIFKAQNASNASVTLSTDYKRGTSSIDSTANQTLLITVTEPFANGSNAITTDGYYVEAM